MKKMIFTGLCAAFLLFGTVFSANALTFDLNIDLSSTGLGTPPYGQVVLTQVGSDVVVTVNLTAGYQFVNTGAGGGYNFLFNATGVTLADLSDTGLTFAGSDSTFGIHADGSGFWNFGVVFAGQGTGGSNALPGPITFTVADALVSDLVKFNPDQYLFAADLLAPNGSTGVAAVPEPGTLILLGSGLLGLAGVVGARKKFRK